MPSESPGRTILRQGSIVYGRILDSQGNPLTDHAALVLTPSERIAGATILNGVGVSTKLDRVPADFQIPLEHLHPLAGLTKPCNAVCNWPVKIIVSEIRKCSGYLTRATVKAVLEKIQELIERGVIEGFDE